MNIFSLYTFHSVEKASCTTEIRQQIDNESNEIRLLIRKLTQVSDSILSEFDFY